jgi:competence protein ComEC
MRCALIGFALGVAILQTFPSLPSPAVLGLLLAVPILILAAAHRAAVHPPDYVLHGLRIGGGLLAGVAWAGLMACLALSDKLDEKWEGKDLTVIGTVSSLPVHFEQGVRFQLLVEQVLPNSGEVPVVPRHLALSWYSGFQHDGAVPVPEMKAGERWRLNLRLKRPHGNANPDGFDYEVWLLEQGVRATGTVRPNPAPSLASNPDNNAKPNLDRSNRLLEEFVLTPGHVIERTRGWLRDRIHAALPDKEYAGVIIALVIGDQREISQSDWKVFNRTGIGHLVSISGLHITMIAGLMSSLMLALWRRSFGTGLQLPLRLPAQKAAAMAGMLTALLYVLLAGFGVPAQRTLYMLCVVGLAMWLGRLASVSHILCLALGVVLVLDPWAVLWPGFWLSFGAVAIILFATVGRIQINETRGIDGQPSSPGRIRRAIDIARSATHTQMVVTLGLIPLTMLLFGQISFVSPLANAVAIPLVSFLVTPLSLAGSLLPSPAGSTVLLLAHWLVAELAVFLSWLSNLQLAVWSAPYPSGWAFAAAMSGCLWLLAPKGWPVRWLGTLGLLPLFLNGPSHPSTGEMWVTAFDVGQGSALLVETADRRLLYDTGPMYGPESDGGSRVILPYLRARGITSLDGLIISHSDADHSGGALSILEEIRVGWVASSLPAHHPVVARAPNHVRCEAGQHWQWDKVRFDMLHPTAGSYASDKWKPNARSCTVRLSLGEQSVLLSGDIEAVQENELVNAGKDDLRSTVLLAPHHGSGTSSTLEFLEAVHPELAVFQVGYRNRYRHPKAEVFERYGKLGIKRLRTDESGAVTMVFGAQWTATAYRDEHARYWYEK